MWVSKTVKGRPHMQQLTNSTYKYTDLYITTFVRLHGERLKLLNTILSCMECVCECVGVENAFVANE